MKWLFLLLAFSVRAHAGGAVGNGGDIISCKGATQNQFNGLYVLDYIANYDSQSLMINQDSHPLDTIFKSLYQKGKTNSDFKMMAQSLLAFMQSVQKQIFGQPDYKDSFIWIPQNFGLIDIADENLIQN